MLRYIDTTQLKSWFNKVFMPTLIDHEQRITALEDISGGGGVIHSASLYSSHNQTVLSATPTQLLFDGADWEDGGHYYDALIPSVLTIPKKHKYNIVVSAEFSPASDGFRRLTLKVNGLDVYEYRILPQNLEYTSLNFSYALDLNKNDTIEVWAYHSSSVPSLTLDKLKTQIFNIS